MTLPLDSADRKIVLLALSLLALLTLAALLMAPGSENPSHGFASTYSTAHDGAKAAYVLLGEMGYREERWVRAPAELPRPGDNTLLIIAGPLIVPSDDEARDLKQFVSAGGHLLVTGWMGGIVGEAKSVRATNPFFHEWHTFAAEMPSSITQRAPEVSMEVSAYWLHLEAGQQRYYGDRTGAVVTKWRLGKGDIVWWAADSPLTNLGITKASNLALFLNCVGPPQHTRVLWDEYFHGVRPGLWHYLSHTPVPWALLQVVILTAALIFTYARRSGVVRPLKRKSRLSPTEFVETVGALYQRKGAAAGALEIAYSRFRFLLARRLAMPSGVATPELIRSVRQSPGFSIPGFGQTLVQIESAIESQKVKEGTALTWIRQLYDYSQTLGLESGNRRIGAGRFERSPE
jgi:hypothetical protein